ncbi:hypothetical protein QC589_11420 [Halomonas elongata]|uniref:hypothetical protein n=1 Tax=Halomonas elongata TaxID=2746 RepID=UPI00334558D5
MTSDDLDSTVLKIIKRVMLLVLGSGFFTNALYIYGMAYYQGYVERLGFEYTLFPIQWGEAILWTYFASQEAGVSTIGAINEISEVFFFVFLFSFYLIARVWIELSDPKRVKTSKGRRNKANYKWGKKVYNLRAHHVWIYRLLYVPLRWVLLKEKSFIAFLASYLFIVFLFFIPMFVVLWVYFPLLGVAHGEAVAEQRTDIYEERLCGDEKDFWSTCLTLAIPMPGERGKEQTVEGKILFKHGSLLGLMTEKGPVTMTMPKTHFHITRKNDHFNSNLDAE